MNTAYFRQIPAPNPLTAARHLIEVQARTIASLAGENARLKAATVTKPSNRTVLPPVTEVDRNEVLECFVTGVKMYRPDAYKAGWIVNGMLDNHNPRYLSPAGVRISEGIRKDAAIGRDCGPGNSHEIERPVILKFVAEFELSHARTAEDTLAGPGALFIWNMVRHRAGLSGVSVAQDFPSWDGRSYVRPPMSKLANPSSRMHPRSAFLDPKK